ncbi:MAG: right-handed parallel beta-helix repeat-containing protein [Verrucomicrobiales bacterium]|nr:right-handed parallel beta-helix repeat-containing protein [Verrucomicrobiales bacterium]
MNLRTHIIAVGVFLAVFGFTTHPVHSQTIPGGTMILGPVSTVDPGDTYPTHWAEFGKGGWRSAANWTEVNSIPADRIEDGMAVWQFDSNRFLVRISGQWVPYNEGNGTVVVDSVTDLVALDPASLNLVGLTSVETAGRNSSGDGGGATFDFYLGDTTSTNLGTVFRDNGATGRWKIRYWDGRVSVFGAFSGVLTNASDPANLVGVDSSPPIQSAIDTLHSIGGGELIFESGTYWLGATIWPKPYVNFTGKSGPTGFYASRSTGQGITSRTMGVTYLETYSPSGVGYPAIYLDGPRYYTNMYRLSFVNADGDTITYYSGANQFRDLVVSGYQWAFTATNQLPVAGMAVDQVEGVRLDNVGFVNIAGHGLWTQGAAGLHVTKSTFLNCLEYPIYVSYSSDTRWVDNIISGTVVLYRANTHVWRNNEIWNPSQSLVNYSGLTTNITAFGRTVPTLIERTYNSDATDDTFYSATQFGANPRRLVYFTGSNLPAPFQAGTAYFVINTSDQYRIKLASSAINAAAGTAIDITETKTNGSWSLTGFDANFVAKDCDEIFLDDNRLDQSFQNTVELDGVTRSTIRNNDIWEIGLNQSVARLNRATTDKFYSGVRVANSAQVKISGNQFQGGYTFTSNPNNLRGTFSGVWVTNSTDISVQDSKFYSLKYGIYSSAGSGRVIETGSVWSDDVAYAAYPQDQDSLNSINWNGLNFSGTNAVVSSVIPSSKTNLTTFTISATVPWSTPRVITGGDSYEPIFIIGPTADYTTTNAPNDSLVAFLYKQNGTTNTYLIFGLHGSSGSYRRSSYEVTEESFRGMPLNIILSRTNTTWTLWVNGISSTPAMSSTAGTPPASDAAIAARYLKVGFWPSETYRLGWMGPIGVWNRKWTDTEMRSGMRPVGGSSLLVQWDWRSPYRDVVPDNSANGVNGTINSLDGTAPEFGPSQDRWSEWDVTNSKLWIKNPVSKLFDIQFAGGGGGITNFAVNGTNISGITNSAQIIWNVDSGIVTASLADDITITTLRVSDLVVSNSVPVVAGGTGLSNVVANSFLVGRGTNPLSALQPVAKGIAGWNDSGAATNLATGVGVTNSGGVISVNIAAGTTNVSISTSTNGQILISVSGTSSSGGADVSGSGTSSNATSFELGTFPVVNNQSLTLDLLVSGSGPTNSFAGRMLAKAVHRYGTTTIVTNPPTIHNSSGFSDAWLSLTGSNIVLNARGSTSELYTWSYKGSTLVQTNGDTNQSGLFGVSKTGLLAAYDFTNNLDSHTAGPFNLSESNSPTYLAGIGTAISASTSFWAQAGITTNYMTNSASSFTVAFRWKMNTAASGSWVLWSHAGRMGYRWIASSNQARVAQLSTSAATIPNVTNVYSVVILSYDATTNRVVWDNGTNFVSQGAYETSTGPLLVGTDSSSGAYARGASFDWVYIWKRALTTNEIAKLNTLTTDNALVYPNLDP